MTLSNKQIVETLVSIEKDFPVNKLRYGDIHVWPYIRIYLATHMANEGRYTQKPTLWKTLYAYWRSTIHSLINMLVCLKIPFPLINV